MDTCVFVCKVEEIPQNWADISRIENEIRNPSLAAHVWHPSTGCQILFIEDTLNQLCTYE